MKYPECEASFLLKIPTCGSERFEALHFGWRDNAYGSIYYTIIGLHAIHVIVGLLFSLVVQLKVALGRIDRDRHVTLDVYSLYWHFVDVVWIFVFSSLILSVHWR